jgi:hypothetical protein
MADAVISGRADENIVNKDEFVEVSPDNAAPPESEPEPAAE